MSTPRSAAIPVRRATPKDAGELVRLRGIMLGSLARSDDDGTAWEPHAVRLLRQRLADPAGDLAIFVVDWPKEADVARPKEAGGTNRSGTGTDQSRGDDRAGRALAACAAGTVEHRLPGPHSPLGLVGHVFNVATDPALRRRGYSRACMTALLAWYRERGVRKIDLHASAEGEPLYADLGFTRKADPAMRLEY